MKQILILCLCILAAPWASAQKFPVRPVTAKTAEVPSLIGVRQLSSLRAAGLNHMAAALEIRYTQATAQQAAVEAPRLAANAATPAPSIHTPAASRPWLQQKRRDLKAWQLKRQRRTRDEQLRQAEAARLEREALLATLPQLNPQHTFQTEHFTDLLTGPLPPTPLPLLEEEGVLYRGMALPADGEAIKNILENGLRLEDLGSHATTKLLAMSGGMRGTVKEVRPVTNLTSLPSEALYWATKRVAEEKQVKDDKPLPVIVAVNGQTQSGEVVLCSQDIPAEQITHVLVPLQVDDTPVWAKVELTANHTFAVTPYDIPPTLQP